MRSTILYLLALLIFAASCKKKEYPKDEVVNDPVFYFRGNINGNFLSFNAGDDNFYMFSSSGQDNNGVYNFLGALRRTDCQECGNAFMIQINDVLARGSGQGTDINAAIKPGTYPFFTDNNIPWRVEFKSSFNKTAATYLWDFGDGQTSTLQNPEHVYSRSGTYEVSLRIEAPAPNSCVSFVKNRIRVGNNAFYASFAASNNGSNSVAFVPNLTGGSGPFQFFWNFGDGFTSTLTNPTHSYKNKGSYPVSLRVTDAMGNTCNYNYNYVTQNDVSSCASNMSISRMATAHPNAELGLGAAFVKWQEPGGKIYTSQSVEQDTSSYFKILSVEDFEKNENGRNTKKLKVRLKCTVYDGTQYIRVDNAEAVMAVAY